jgi:ribonuclease J
MDKHVRILPLGGCCEIGMNMTLFNIEGLFYIVDCGVLFPEPQHVGVDYIVPSIQTLIDAKIKIQAWLITHGHEDHIGGLPFIYPRLKAPLYSTHYTLELIKGKFIERKIKDYSFHTWKVNETLSLPKLKVTPFTVNHSIPAATGLFLETPTVNLIHTGDFRIDRNPPEGSKTHENIQKVIGKKPVHLYMADSTNSFVEGHDHDEEELLPNFVKIFEQSKGKVLVTSFASNVWRIQTILRAAHQAKRKVFLLGRSVERMSQLAHETGVIPAELFRSTVLSDESELKKTKDQDLVIICTGSQGEEASALFRLVLNTHNSIEVNAHDTVVFSSRPIPGNERKISGLMNYIVKRGAKIITGKDFLVHVSGHGYKDDLITLFKAVKPKFFMPLHGEYRFLKRHTELAEEAGIPFENSVLAENGDIVCLSEDECYIEDRTHVPRDFICQGEIYPNDGPVYRVRTALSKTGLVNVTLVYHRKTKKLMAKPLVQQHGLWNQKYDSDQLVKIFEHVVSSQASENSNSSSGPRWQNEVNQSVIKYFSRTFGYPVYTTVSLVSVGDQPDAQNSKQTQRPFHPNHKKNFKRKPRQDSQISGNRPKNSQI